MPSLSGTYNHFLPDKTQGELGALRDKVGFSSQSRYRGREDIYPNIAMVSRYPFQLKPGVHQCITAIDISLHRTIPQQDE